jgi:hypothetical protein
VNSILEWEHCTVSVSRASLVHIFILLHASCYISFVSSYFAAVISLSSCFPMSVSPLYQYTDTERNVVALVSTLFCMVCLALSIVEFMYYLKYWVVSIYDRCFRDAFIYTRDIWKVASGELLTKQAIKKKLLYTKLLLNIVIFWNWGTCCIREWVFLYLCQRHLSQCFNSNKEVMQHVKIYCSEWIVNTERRIPEHVTGSYSVRRYWEWVIQWPWYSSRIVLWLSED